jgi:hypothetical protein
MRTEFHDRQSSNICGIAHATLCDLNYLLSDHLGKGIIPVNQTDASQRLLISRRQSADFFRSYWHVLQKPMYRHAQSPRRLASLTIGTDLREKVVSEPHVSNFASRAPPRFEPINRSISLPSGQPLLVLLRPFIPGWRTSHCMLRRIRREVKQKPHMPWLANTFWQFLLSLVLFCCKHCWTAPSSPNCCRQKRCASRLQACCSCGVPM